MFFADDSLAFGAEDVRLILLAVAEASGDVLPPLLDLPPLRPLPLPLPERPEPPEVSLVILLPSVSN